MTQSIVFDRSLIAPCGMNCGTCMAYLRDKNKCCGCLQDSLNKPKTRLHCRIKNCEKLDKTTSKFCYECDTFPCKRLQQLDKRYRTKYRVSFIRNLLAIKETGITNYLANESIRWACPQCGSIICVHRDRCMACNLDLKQISS
jgi:hypothetical protein